MDKLILNKFLEIPRNLTSFYDNTIRKVESEIPIAKGYVSDSLSRYGDNLIKVKKTGTQIRRAIPKLLHELSEREREIQIKCEMLLENLSDYGDYKPNQDRTSYNFPTIKCKCFSYDMCESKYDHQLNQYQQPQPYQQCCNSYNILCSEWISIKEDIMCLTALMNSVDDETYYDMTVSQLIATGFGTDDDVIENDGLLRSEEDSEIEKGGVGSGRKIGTTTSGKTIYLEKHPKEYKNFNAQDHKEASEIHKKLRSEYLVSSPRTSEHHKEYADGHSKLSNESAHKTHGRELDKFYKEQGVSREEAESDENNFNDDGTIKRSQDEELLKSLKESTIIA